MNVKPESLRHQPLKHKFNPALNWRDFFACQITYKFIAVISSPTYYLISLQTEGQDIFVAPPRCGVLQNAGQQQVRAQPRHPGGMSATECNLMQWGARLRHISATFCNAVQFNETVHYISLVLGTLPTVYTVACQGEPFESRPLVTRNNLTVTVMPKYILSLMLFYLSMRNHAHLCTDGHDNAEQSVSDAW
jgi:hypothetical protein